MITTNHLNRLAAGTMLAAVGLILASCSNSDAPESPTTSNRIRFAANTDYTRAPQDFTTSNLKTFNVTAYVYDGTTPVTYMNNVTVTKQGADWTYSPVAVWPAGQAVDFYAYAPASWLDGYNPLGGVVYSNTWNDQDLIYATQMDLQGNTGQPNGQVVFNFHHALSKLTLALSCTKADLDVKVTNIVVWGLNSEGNFHFPTESTTPQGTVAPAPDVFVFDPNVKVAATDGAYWNSWTAPGMLMYHISSTLNERLTLTNVPTNLSSTGNGFKYVIPQPLVWDANGGDGDMYIAVQASVYDKETGTKLWPNGNTPADQIVEGSVFGDGIMKFPLKTSNINEFKPGMHYTYSLVLNGLDQMGSIEFGQPSVDTFLSASARFD